MRMCAMFTWVLSLSLAAGASGADYKVEATSEGPPTADVAAEIAAQLGESGVKISKGSRVYLEFWPTKEWTTTEGFSATNEIIYPLTPGSLVGVARFKSKGADFRDQEIKTGVYTVRYGRQPVDGNHVGTAPTRDFFLLLPAADDQSTEPLDTEALFKASAEAAETTHPAIFYLQRAPEAASEPALEHDEENEWWTLSFTGKGKDGTDVPVRLIVVGHGQE